MTTNLASRAEGVGQELHALHALASRTGNRVLARQLRRAYREGGFALQTSDPWKALEAQLRAEVLRRVEQEVREQSIERGRQEERQATRARHDQLDLRESNVRHGEHQLLRREAAVAERERADLLSETGQALKRRAHELEAREAAVSERERRARPSYRLRFAAAGAVAASRSGGGVGVALPRRATQGDPLGVPAARPDMPQVQACLSTSPARRPSQVAVERSMPLHRRRRRGGF